MPVENARARGRSCRRPRQRVRGHDVHAWVLASDGILAPPSSRRRPGSGIDHQAAMMRRAQLRARRPDRRGARGRRSGASEPSGRTPGSIGRMRVGGHRCRLEHRAPARRGRRCRTGRRAGRARTRRTSGSAPRSSEPGRCGAKKIRRCRSVCVGVRRHGRRARRRARDGDRDGARPPGRRPRPQLDAALREATRLARAGCSRPRARDGSPTTAPSRGSVGGVPERRRRRRRRRRLDGDRRRRRRLLGADLGALGRPRLAAAHPAALSDDPADGAASGAAARRRVARALDGLDPPRPVVALAVGRQRPRAREDRRPRRSTRDDARGRDRILARRRSAKAARDVRDRRRRAPRPCSRARCCSAGRRACSARPLDARPRRPPRGRRARARGKQACEAA